MHSLQEAKENKPEINGLKIMQINCTNERVW